MHTTKTVSQGLSYTETLREKGGKNLPVVNLICARHCAISVYLLFQDAPFNQSILKEISPEYSLEGLMLKLKLQSFGHQMGRTDSFEKTLRLGKVEGKRRRGRERMRWLDGITDSITWVWVGSGPWWWTGKPVMLQSMRSQGVGHDWAPKLNWTDWSPVKAYWASQVALVVKNPPANTGDIGHVSSISGSGRSPGGGNGNPLPFSCLENSIDRRARWATVHKVAQSWTRLK